LVLDVLDAAIPTPERSPEPAVDHGALNDAAESPGLDFANAEMENSA
jgi:hypothetical protein